MDNYYTLRFADKAAADSVMMVTLNLDGETLTVHKYVHTVYVGLIFHEGSETPHPGWHVDVTFQGPLPDELKPFEIPFPAKPKHKYQSVYEGMIL